MRTVVSVRGKPIAPILRVRLPWGARLFAPACTVALHFIGCSDHAAQSSGGTGGTTSIAGVAASNGGSLGGNGTTVVRQAVAGASQGTSLASSLGGTTGVGGLSITTGGATAVGGTTANSEATASGGAANNHGGSGSGGTIAVSSTVPVSVGGAVTNGGNAQMGGNASTGGTKPIGGSSSSGGRGGTGNSSIVGGTNGAGGTTGPVTLSCPGAAPAGITPDWCSCDQWGEWANGSATLYNDIWGSGAGKECIWATKSNQFGVVAAHPSGGSVKSYPNISYSPGQAISAIGVYSSSFDVTVPSNGVYETTYDLWVKNNNTRIEIMLWVNKAGGNNPIARYDSSGKPIADASNVNVGGHTWNTYYGSNGANHVVSLLRTSNTNTGTVDIKAILNWIIANEKSFTSSWTLDQVQFGYEIISDSGTQSFVTNAFSVTSN